MKDMERLLRKINRLEKAVRSLRAEGSAGQISSDVSVYQLDFTHQHPLSGISNLSKLAGTLLIYSAEVLSVDEASINHDALTNYVANKHIDWTGATTTDLVAQSLTATTSGVATHLILGAAGDNTNPYTLIEFNIERAWDMKKRGAGAGTLLTLEGTSDKQFWIAVEGIGSYAAKFQVSSTPANNYTDVYALRVNGTETISTARGAFFVAAVNLAGGTTYKVEADGGAIFKSLTIPAGNILMGGSGTDDERLRVSYLTAIPSSVDNGSLWMEADGLHGYLAAAERNLSRPHCLDSYIDIKERQAVWNIHGGIESISTGNALDSVPTDITDTIGLGKIIVVINAGGDVTGEITVTGTTVDRDTGAETGADTDTLTVDTLSTDNSGTDSGGNVTYAFVNAYMTSKWFKGAVTLSTTNLTLTDVDIYQCSFEQFNDLPNVTIDTFDTNQFANNASANIYWHLYSVKPSGDKVTLAKEKSMELLAADVSANLHYRLRRGNLAISIDGTTQGFFVQCYPEPLNNIYWEDINLKIWYY